VVKNQLHAENLRLSPINQLTTDGKEDHLLTKQEKEILQEMKLISQK